MQEQGIWPRHAGQWQRVGPPLRPGPDDARHVEACITAWTNRQRRAAPRALLLGVTPELATLRWPDGTTLLAVDRALPMIHAVWPGDLAWRHAVCGDWRALPCASAAWDVILGDGVLNVLPDTGHYAAILRACANALAPGGRVLLRLFVRPPVRETVAAVFATIAGGSFHAFKWRLAMAVQGPYAERGVALHDIWQAWHAHAPDSAAFAAAQGWPQAAVATIEAYRGQDTRYNFPTAEEVEAACAPWFRLDHRSEAPYELGERCPRYVLAARTDVP